MLFGVVALTCFLPRFVDMKLAVLSLLIDPASRSMSSATCRSMGLDSSSRSITGVASPSSGAGKVSIRVTPAGSFCNIMLKSLPLLCEKLLAALIDEFGSDARISYILKVPSSTD